jgi:PEP-CTERM motif
MFLTSLRERIAMTNRCLFLITGILMLAAGPSQAAPITLQNATATFSQSGFGGFPVSDSIDGNAATSGWAIDPNEVNQIAVFETTTDLFTSGGTLTFNLTQTFGTQHTIGRFRLSATTDVRSNFADGLQTGGDVSANWVILDPTAFSSTAGATMTEQGDNSILLSGVNPDTDTYLVTALTNLSGITGFRLEVIEDPSLPGNGPGRQPSNGNFVLTNFAVDGVAAVAGVPGVPEPGSLVLLVAALGAWGIARRRKNR